MMALTVPARAWRKCLAQKPIHSQPAASITTTVRLEMWFVSRRRRVEVDCKEAEPQYLKPINFQGRKGRDVCSRVVKRHGGSFYFCRFMFDFILHCIGLLTASQSATNQLTVEICDHVLHWADSCRTEIGWRNMHKQISYMKKKCVQGMFIG